MDVAAVTSFTGLRTIFGREKSAKLLANTSSLCYELEGTDRHSREVVFDDSNE